MGEKTPSLHEKVEAGGGHTPPGDAHAPIYDIAVLNQDYEGKPTEEELATLRRVPGKVPVIAYLLCAVEFCERASYYGEWTYIPSRLRGRDTTSELGPRFL